MNTPHRILLSLGSNERKETNMQEAIRLLHARFPSLCFSEPVLTAPIETPIETPAETKSLGTKRAETKSIERTSASRDLARDSSPDPLFLNCVAVGHAAESPETIRQILKAIEHRLGRRPQDKAAGRIPIDIDLLQWDEEVLKPADLSRAYVIQGLSSVFERIKHK